MGGHDQSDLFYPYRSWALVTVTDFWRESAKKYWHTPPLFCALAFRNGWEDRSQQKMYELTLPMILYTSGKGLMNFDQ